MIQILQQVMVQMVQLQYSHQSHQLGDYEVKEYMMLLLHRKVIDEMQVMELIQVVYHQELLQIIHLDDEDEIAEIE